MTRRQLLSAAGVQAGGAGLTGAALTGCDFFTTEPAAEDGDSGTSDSDQKESPMLARRVQDGDLPRLEDRLPTDPLVVEPLNEPGRYGGTLRDACIGPGGISDIETAMVPGLFQFSHDLAERYPNLAESVEFSENYRTCVIQLRQGVRWSDGEPFTADDVIFYFEDWQFNEELSPVVAPRWIQNGERMAVTKAGSHTVQFDFAAPTPVFAGVQYAGPTGLIYAPKHFLRHYHPRYNPDAPTQAEQEGYDNWQDQFLFFAGNYSGGRRVG